MHADGGVNSGWGCEVSNRAYGLNEPSLEGFLDVLVAPFKAATSVVKTAVKTAVTVVPGAVTGFIAGGPIGAAIGGASRLIPSGTGSTGTYTPTPTINVGSGTYLRTSYATNPYGTEVQAYQSSQYQTPYQAPDRSFGDQAKAVFQLLKDELLARGGQAIAETPQGAAAIREKIRGDIGQYMLPIALGGGALLLVMAMRR